MRILRIVAAFVVFGAFATAFPDEASTAARLEKAKRSEPELIAFLKSMPKGADLHNHVTGAIYSDYMLDYAIGAGLHFNRKTNAFQKEPAEDTVPAAKLTEDWTAYRAFMYSVSMAGSFPAVKSGHDHFFDTFGFIGPANNGRNPADSLTEVIARNQAQNVQYLELMTSVAPGSAMSAFMKDAPPVDDFEFAFRLLEPRFEALRAESRRYLDQRDAEVARRLGRKSVSGVEGPTDVRYVASLNRLGANAEFFVTAAAAMAIIQADKRVVAMNIVAPEDFVTARQNFDFQMRAIDFLWRRMGRPNLTLHAGELTLEISPYETMRDRIRKTIELGHAKRIGHGVSVAWEDDLPGLLKLMRDQGVAVEICLTSNASILKVEGDRHPIHLYLDNGIPLNLNTDDEGVSRSNLTQEYVRAVRSYGFSYARLKDLVRNGLEYSFLPGEGLYVARDYRRLRPEFAEVRKPSWSPGAAAKRLMDANEKLAIQVRLERAFVAFEN
ncbi:MAG: hypothetical protein KIS66_14830 [Fimbriimonadaceae bacterium]|nr:hypothetical protein [Fimbriimonadaceae bacterium]